MLNGRRRHRGKEVGSREYSTVQYSTVQYSTLQYSTADHEQDSRSYPPDHPYSSALK